MAKFEFSMSMGYVGCERKDVIEIPDEDFDEEWTEQERDRFIEKEWEEWTWSYVDGGWKELNAS